MTIAERFKNATERVQDLPQRPKNDDLLALYGLYKQATEGDVSGRRPGVLDVRSRAKHDAWTALAGKSKDDAMAEYVDLVTRLEG